jgi:hypothetical protein
LLGLVVFALAKMVETRATFGIDNVVRGPDAAMDNQATWIQVASFLSETKNATDALRRCN